MRMFLFLLFIGASSSGALIGSMAGALNEVREYRKAGVVVIDATKLSSKQLMHMPLRVLAEYPVVHRG